MEKIPVNIISGFLGSGKTTAILKLHSQKTSYERWAIIINEFGKISIDSQTLMSHSQAGAVFDISGGCICCSAKGYFQENLEKIILSGNYTRIIIEPSGLGGIDMVSEIIAASAGLRLMPVVCLVDIAYIENSRLQNNPIYRMQISKADIIIFSKCDLLADLKMQDHLIEKFKSHFPDKKQCLAANNSFFWPSILDSNALARKKENEFRMIKPTNSLLSDNKYHQENFQFGADAIFDTDRLARFFHNQPGIVRAKGHINTNKGWILINFTLSGFNFEPCRAKDQNEIVIIIEQAETNIFQNLSDKIEKAII